MLRSTVVVAVLALTFAACGGESGTGEKAQNEVTPVVRTGPAETPEETFANIKKIFANEEWSKVADFIPPSKIVEAEAEFKEQMADPGAALMLAMFEIDPEKAKTMTYREFMAAMFETMMKKDPIQMEEVMGSEILETIIDGDKATLKVKAGDKENDIELLREDGLWYMAEMGN
jgi:hypothetical protein